MKLAAGPDGILGVFKDDGEAGFLYVYEAGGNAVRRHLHIYDRSACVFVEERDVRVLWSEDFSKCGVEVWGKLRGIIELNSDREGRVWLESRHTPGIGDPEWLKGFSL